MNKKIQRAYIIAPYIGMATLIFLTQIFALILAAPFEKSNIKAFQNPESIANPIYFFILILLFTAFIFILLKYRKKWLVYLVMIAAIAITVYYVVDALIPYDYIPLAITLLLTFFLYKYPEWYVIDAMGLIVGGGATAIFGISLGIIPVFILLIILAAYDATAVYKTKHMISLADSVIEMRIPVLFVLPKTRKFSLFHEMNTKEGLFMGLGDAIIPSMLIISANSIFSTSSSVSAAVPVIALATSITISAPALGAMIGIFFGYSLLCIAVNRGKAQAGLPFLNSFAIIGFLIGCFFS